MRSASIIHRDGACAARPAELRGMTLVELMLALSITAMVATAIAGMLHAMTTGVVTKRDCRDVMVRASAAQSRLSSYITPARCILAVDGGNVTMWLKDSRESNTVHATEIRWLLYDATDGAIDVWWVALPSGWSQLAKDLADFEYRSSQDWDSVLSTYTGLGYVKHLRLVDGLTDVVATTDQTNALDSKQVEYALEFAVTSGGASQQIEAGSTVLQHQPPTS